MSIQTTASLSGTVGETLDAMSVIEKAARKCGLSPSQLGAEQLANAKDSLLLILVSLSNRGVNLWAVDKRVRMPAAGETRVTLPEDTISILNANYRVGTYTLGSFAVAPTSTVGSSIVCDYGVGASVRVDSASVLVPAAGLEMMKIILEFSNDGATWADVGGATHYKPMVGTFLGVDSIRADTTGRYWRVRTEDLTLTFTNSGVFATSTREVPMYQMTRDTYVSMPNKLSQSAVPLQYFFDKQELTPYLWFWPAIATIGPQIVIWIQRRLQDVGALTNRLDVPTRWLNAIIFRLSVQMCLELPKELSIEGRLDVLMQQAEAATREAEDGEVDGAPIRIMPNIGMYRG